MNHSELRQFFYQSLTEAYHQGELMPIYHWCMQEIHGWSRAEVYLHNYDELSESELNQWKAIIPRLRKHEPVQYIFNKAFFRDLELYVNPRVLIPRPETEELVGFVLEHHNEPRLRVLDIGTGSGCIPLAIKQERPYWDVSACDVSEDALVIAKQNSKALKLEVNFFQFDALNGEYPTEIGKPDIIISNPPYIPSKRKTEMDANVIDHEPVLALFVPDEEPFLFFTRITELAIDLEVKEVWFETEARDIPQLLEALSERWKGRIETLRDMAGKERFVRCSI